MNDKYIWLCENYHRVAVVYRGHMALCYRVVVENETGKAVAVATAATAEEAIDLAVIRTGGKYELSRCVIELEEQRDALVCENMALKAAHNNVLSDFDKTMRQITGNNSSTVLENYPVPKTPMTNNLTGEWK